ncbi:hypothetical protein [Candidatus Ruminimicrobium bovinum]|uniref:hypothetical protein n=1 Tax=Candidatus Ruminimicrobium bovinum TaxID=3242779 RepID=UPI0039B9BD22
MIKKMMEELKEHSPFTLFGALTGIILMMLFKNMEHETAHTLFYIFHPLHIFLSAIVTAALYKKYSNNGSNVTGFIKILIIGYTGSIVIGTLSDSLIPFWGETLLDMPQRHSHIGFIEKWWLINPIAIIAVIIAYFYPKTKLSHASHVLISTWASLFHIIMALEKGNSVPYFAVFIFLFIAVWLPCCFSDIVFPMLFVKNSNKK